MSSVFELLVRQHVDVLRLSIVLWLTRMSLINKSTCPESISTNLLLLNLRLLHELHLQNGFAKLVFAVLTHLDRSS